MIKIGVNENVFVSKVEKNEKGTLNIEMTEAASVKKASSLLDQMSSGDDTSGNSSSTGFLLFPPSREYQNEMLSPERLVQNLMKFKNQLSHILKRFTPEKNITWNPFAGMLLKTEGDLLKAVQDEAKFLQIYTNIVDQFITQAVKFKVVDPAKLSRLFLVRQSKEKHFGRFRDNFLDTQPFFESMEIPKDRSVMWVKAGSKGATTYFEPVDGFVPNFTDYEIKNQKDNPIQSATAADTPTNAPEEAAAVESVFGAPANAEQPVDFSAAPEEEAPMQFGIPQDEELPSSEEDPTKTEGE